MSIASAIFSDSQSRVYAWLFGQPERTYHFSELLRLTGLGSASLQRELRRLAEAGLVRSERVGNLRCYVANAQSPVFDELVALTRKALGTVARQADTAASDVDVMLVGNDLLLSEVLDVLVPLEPQLGRKINPTCYTPLEFAQRRAEPDSFVNRVLLQPTLALIGDADGVEPAG